MRVPQVAFLAMGLTDNQRMLASLGVPVSGGPSLESVQDFWNARLREIAEQAIPGSIAVGDLQIAATAMIAMVTYEVDDDAVSTTQEPRRAEMVPWKERE